MSKLRLAGLILIVLSAILAIVQMAVYYNQLPERVASHFNAAGEPDGFSSRGSFISFCLGIQAFVMASLLFSAWILTRLPISLLNIPNREYWLDETRRASTLRINQDILLFLAGATALFLVFMFQLTIQANLVEPPVLNSLWTWFGLGAYLALIGAVCGWLLWRFSKIPTSG